MKQAGHYNQLNTSKQMVPQHVDTSTDARTHAGPKEGIGALAWHPLRSILASTAPNTGRIYLWARSYAEKWSAFAPDFKVCLLHE
jgi:hypothetical protein